MQQHYSVTNTVTTILNSLNSTEIYKSQYELSIKNCAFNLSLAFS